MYRFGIALIAGALCACVLSGCTADPSTGQPTGKPSPSEPSAAVTATVGLVQLPVGAHVLVPVRAGAGSSALPTFRSNNTAYTVVLSCTGTGKLNISRKGFKGVVEPCDGVPTVYRVFHPSGDQDIRLIADAAASWSAGVVDGAPNVG
jgi:hypothetical protein